MAKGKLKFALQREQFRTKEAALKEQAAKNKKELKDHIKAKASGNKKRKVEQGDNQNEQGDQDSSTNDVKPQPRPKFWFPFDKHHKVLLIGEGDFSFSHSILSQDLVSFATATCLDSEQELLKKYPSTVSEHLTFLKENSQICEVLYQIDGTKLEKSKPLRNNIGRYDFCIFNFPHLGNSIKDQDRNILQHQKLMMEFFKSAKHMINPVSGKILLTLFEGEPYRSWNIKQLARANGFSLERSGNFEWDAYPEYSHHLTSKEGHTSKPQKTRPAKMYVFELYKEKKGKKQDKGLDKRKRKEPESDDNDDSD